VSSHGTYFRVVSASRQLKANAGPRQDQALLKLEPDFMYGRDSVSKSFEFQMHLLSRRVLTVKYFHRFAVQQK